MRAVIFTSSKCSFSLNIPPRWKRGDEHGTSKPDGMPRMQLIPFELTRTFTLIAKFPLLVFIGPC